MTQSPAWRSHPYPPLARPTLPGSDCCIPRMCISPSPSTEGCIVTEVSSGSVTQGPDPSHCRHLLSGWGFGLGAGGGKGVPSTVVDPGSTLERQAGDSARAKVCSQRRDHVSVLCPAPHCISVHPTAFPSIPLHFPAQQSPANLCSRSHGQPLAGCCRDWDEGARCWVGRAL